ncbi:MAG: type II secretion system protein GspI [Sphingomonadaceae bacterium]
MRRGPQANGPEAGFALVELLVAMLLLSLVGLTLARFQTFQLAGASGLAAAAAARLEADNRAVDLLAMTDAPAAPLSGVSRNFGRDWYWTATPGPSPDPMLMPDLVAIEIGVSLEPGGPAVVTRRLLRPRSLSDDAPGEGARPASPAGATA